MKNALIPAQGPQIFLKAPLRGGVRCAHGAARTERPPVSTDRARTAKSTDFLDFLLRSFKIATTFCDGMRRLLEWSLGAASDDHAALEDGLSMRIGKQKGMEKSMLFSG